jgi:cation diffusion facilitator family transporter
MLFLPLTRKFEVIINTDQRSKQSNLALMLGLIANIVLAILKTSIGLIGHSPALLADGINSTSDVVYYLVVGIFIRAAHKPADVDHPYGHTQYENIGALVVGSFVITTAVTIFWNSINTLFDLVRGDSSFQGGSELALWVALFTIGIKIVLSFLTNRIGKNTQNASIIALAADHRNDILAASAAAIGIFLGRLGNLWVDPLAGAVVSLFILRTGISILRDSISDLMDTVPGKALHSQVNTLLAAFPEIKEIDKIQAHRFGIYFVINITISVDGRISVYEGDKIANQVERQLKDNISNLLAVHVHFHPRIQYRAEE